MREAGDRLCITSGKHVTISLMKNDWLYPHGYSHLSIVLFPKNEI